MRLGLLLAGQRPASDAVALSREAEAAGVADVWVSEDYFESGAFALAGAVAGATSQARVGIGIVNPWTRHPMLIAMEFLTLSELAPGRTILGLGVSNRTWMQDQCGIAFRLPVAALDEATTIVRAAMAGEQVTTAGEHFTTNARLSRRESAPSRIYFGVKGRRMLALAAERADGVLLSILSAPGYIRWARQQIGPSPELTAYVLVSCGPNARGAIRRPLASLLGLHGEHDITIQGGLDSGTANRFRAGWLEQRDLTDEVSDDLIDRFAVAGDVDECCARLDHLAQAGLQTAILRDPGDHTVDDLLQLANTYLSRRTLHADQRSPAP